MLARPRMRVSSRSPDLGRMTTKAAQSDHYTNRGSVRTTGSKRSGFELSVNSGAGRHQTPARYSSKSSDVASDIERSATSLSDTETQADKPVREKPSIAQKKPCTIGPEMACTKLSSSYPPSMSRISTGNVAPQTFKKSEYHNLRLSLNN